ncbi:hypothetical protein [Streptomyces acidiscabies]|uniref:hypothetical protein n=1 Tax=Streptomyces acidiscabies TaxID=42234 RepID=UPI001C4CA66D|nr:hypothetical protein [Streptomyces acidiscabies]
MRQVGLAVLVLLAVGCTSTGETSSTGEETTPAASVPVSSPAVSLAEVAGERASAAYVGMWQDMAEAAKTSDWRSPVLGRYATGDALSAISRGLYADHRNGLVARGGPKNYPKVTSATPEENPTEVLIADCGDSTNWLKYRKSDGQLADDKPGGRRAITAEVKKQTSGSWKVTRFAVEGLGSC